MQCWTNVEDVRHTCYTNTVCLLGMYKTLIHDGQMFRFSAHTRHRTGVVFMLGQRRRLGGGGGNINILSTPRFYWVSWSSLEPTYSILSSNLHNRPQFKKRSIIFCWHYLCLYLTWNMHVILMVRMFQLWFYSTSNHADMSAVRDMSITHLFF